MEITVEENSVVFGVFPAMVSFVNIITITIININGTHSRAVRLQSVDTAGV